MNTVFSKSEKKYYKGKCRENKEEILKLILIFLQPAIIVLLVGYI